MKHKILECKEQFINFDKYVCAIGLPKLMNATESSLKNDVLNTVPATALEVFKQNPDSNIKLYHSIVPYGAGGSFLGVLQDLARGSISIVSANAKDRKANLWDDAFGLNFNQTPTFDEPGVNRTADIEDNVLALTNNNITWRELWRIYLSLITKFNTSANVTREIQTHVDLLTLPFFVEVERTFFLDMDFERFVWTSILANMKHAVNGVHGAKNVKRFVDGETTAINPIKLHLERCNDEWKIYCIAKEYGVKPKLKLTYDDIFVKQDYYAIKQFLEATIDADSSDNAVSVAQRLLKLYHNENLNIMNNWDNVKDKILNYKWDRTHG